MPQLFDASSLINIVVEMGGQSLGLLRGNYVLDLTFYEVGNALWRIHSLEGKLSLSEVKMLMGVTAELMGWVDIVPVSELNLVEIVELAIKESATFYDVAYVTAAKLRKLTLVTDDAKLARVASKHVKVKSSGDL